MTKHTLRELVAYKTGCEARRDSLTRSEARLFSLTYKEVGTTSAFWAGYFGNNL